MLATSARHGDQGLDPVPKDQLDLEAWAGEMLNRRPAVGFAVGVIRDDGLVAFRSHGLADIERNIPITQDTVFRIASITKTFTAIAVMQLWEQGLIDLDAPANDYLHSYRLIPANLAFAPTTVRHLLTHTSGVGEVARPRDAFRQDFGESFPLDQPLPTLAEYYRGELRTEVEPGTRFTYSDHGFATLGQIVEDTSGKPLGEYFRDHIFEPLGMADTDLARSAQVEAGLATGYDLRASGPDPVNDRQWVTGAASSVYSTPRDMAQYLAALLNGGSNRSGSVLRPETVALMFEPHYRPDPRVPGIGLGFFRVSCGGHPAVEHGGILPGFNSQIFLAPGDDVGVMAFSNGAKGAMLWLPGEMAGLLQQLIGAPVDGIRTDVPHHPEIWDEVCGWYQLSARLTDARARMMMGAGAEVFVRGGRLMLRILSPIPAIYQGLPLYPDDETDPHVFRIDLSEFGIGTARVVFGHDSDTADTWLHFDLMPMSMKRRPGKKTPRPWITWPLSAAATIGGAISLARRAHRAEGMSSRS